jgi:hypothetical protein
MAQTPEDESGEIERTRAVKSVAGLHFPLQFAAGLITGVAVARALAGRQPLQFSVFFKQTSP